MECILRMGDRGDDVKKLQKLLNDKLALIHKIKEDGVFGKNRDSLVKKISS